MMGGISRSRDEDEAEGPETILTAGSASAAVTKTRQCIMGWYYSGGGAGGSAGCEPAAASSAEMM